MLLPTFYFACWRIVYQCISLHGHIINRSCFYFLFLVSSFNFFYCSLHISDAILKTLRADGNVLLPVDTTGRVLELILILEQVSYKYAAFIFIFFMLLFNRTKDWITVKFTVLGTASLDISHLLPHLCCIKHNWLREEFPWVDEWFNSKVIWAHSW